MVCRGVLVLVEGDGWGGRGSQPEGWWVPTVALEGERAVGGETEAPCGSHQASLRTERRRQPSRPLVSHR